MDHRSPSARHTCTDIRRETCHRASFRGIWALRVLFSMVAREVLQRVLFGSGLTRRLRLVLKTVAFASSRPLPPGDGAKPDFIEAWPKQSPSATSEYSPYSPWQQDRRALAADGLYTTACWTWGRCDLRWALSLGFWFMKCNTNNYFLHSVWYMYICFFGCVIFYIIYRWSLSNQIYWLL